MEEPISEDGEVLMEWAPYSNLISHIPLKVQSGIFAQDLNLTCVDATPEYIALGTNVGLVFWYGRQKGDMQRLRCENSNSGITFVKIVSTVDFMVAAGNKHGQVSVFQIPKEHPDSVPDSLKPKAPRQVERYTVGDLHHSEITYIEWSKNGMRLFSGDRNGLVVMTEIDFYMHLCKSSEIINEAYEIVQISYYQNYLLVSSVFRSIICHKKDLGKWEVNQVGKRDRKSLSKLGGIFHFNYEKPSDVNIYCARPGLRIWTSDKQGNVLQTLLFKEAITNPISQVELLNPAQKKKAKSQKDASFGPLYVYKDKYLVSCHDDLLYVVNPTTLVAVATVDNLRSILSISVNKNEIFILEGDRSLIRISHEPDSPMESPDENLMSKSLTNPLRTAVNTLKEFTTSEVQIHFSDMTEQCNNLVSALKESTISQESLDVSKAEECLELPKIKELPPDINTNLLDKLVNNFMGGKDGILDDGIDPDNENVANELASINNENQMSSNGIAYDNEVMYRTKKSKRNNLIELDAENCETFVLPESHKSKTVTSDACKNSDSVSSDKSTSKMTGVIKESMSKSLTLSPEAIERDIKDKEEILAKLLDLEPVTKSDKKPPSPDLLYLNTKNNIPAKPNNVFALLNENTKTTVSPGKKISSEKIMGKIVKQPSDEKPISPPECVSIPNVWNLKEIQIEHIPNSPKRGKVVNPRKNVEANEEMDDWEFV